MRVIAPAKVNLLLAVGAKRADGYHDVTTVLHALEFADIVTIEPAGSLSLTCDVDLGIAPEQNLAYRAAVALGEALGHEPRVALHVAKLIPHGAGLGGGSSDAAAVIAGLATLWGADVADPRCLTVAATLGADVPFFLQPGGCVLMAGRGDRVETDLPAAAGTPVVLVKPAASVPTAAAYSAFDEDPRPAATPEALTAALRAGDTPAIAAALANNMTAASIRVVSEIADVITWLSAAPGVLGVAVAGSGSAVFALCESDATAASAAAAAGHGWFSAATRLGAAGARVMNDEGAGGR